MADVSFLGAVGEAGERLRALDWANTPMGSPGGWPHTLKTLATVMLAAEQPMYMAWGPGRTLIHNDAYLAVLGRKGASAQGRPFFEVWPETREQLGPLFDRVFSGEFVYEPQFISVLDGDDEPGQQQFLAAYAPVTDVHGIVLGLFCTLSQTTPRTVLQGRKIAESACERRLLDGAPELIGILKGPDHVFEFVNEAFQRLFGERDFVGLRFRDAFTDLEGQEVFEALEEVYEKGVRFVAHHRRVRLTQTPRPAAEERFLDFIFDPITDEAGAVSGVFVDGYDVTGTHRALETAGEREASLLALNAELERRVIERTRERGRTWRVSPVLLSVIDRTGRFDSTNPAWTALLGWSSTELCRAAFTVFVHPDDLESTRASFEMLKRGAPVLKFENRYVCKDGTHRWLSWIAVPEDGKFYCSARDITPEKLQAEELAARTAERDRNWNNSQDLLCIMTADGLIRAVNPAWTEILGWSADELVGRDHLTFNHPDDTPASEDALLAAVDGGLRSLENRVLHKDGSYRWVSWVANADGGFLYGSGRHITAEKEAEARLELAHEALRQAQKMEAVGQLTGGIAHDFNNLLTGIAGSLELLRARIGEGRLDSLERYVAAAEGAASRAAALTHRLLAFSRRQQLEPKPTDVFALVRSLEELIRRTVGPAIDIQVIGPAAVWPTLVDRNQLENAVLNLCINARDAMPQGGQLRLASGSECLSGEAAVQLGLTPGEYLWLAVSDTGSGMTPEVVARAFDPFFTTKPPGVGTGLGLSMVYGFVRQSEGQVAISSRLGEGSTVRLYLPRYTGDIELPDPALPPMHSAPASCGGTVLVVEDEPIVRMLLTELLEDEGYTALEAGDGPSAVRVLESDTTIDLLITDMGLPGGMNGRQVAERGRALRPDLRVLFVTGYSETRLLGDAALDHATQVVGKPFAIEDLKAKISQMIRDEGAPSLAA